MLRLCRVNFPRHTSLCSNHKCSVSIVVLVVDFYKGTFVEQGDDINKTFGHSDHQSSLMANRMEMN